MAAETYRYGSLAVLKMENLWLLQKHKANYGLRASYARA